MHGVHDVAEKVTENAPGSQAGHVGAFVELLAVPGGQGEQIVLEEDVQGAET